MSYIIGASLFSAGFVLGGRWHNFHLRRRKSRRAKIIPMDPAAERDLADARQRRAERHARELSKLPHQPTGE